MTAQSRFVLPVIALLLGNPLMTRASDGVAKPVTLRVGFINENSVKCQVATPCQQVKPEVAQEYFAYLDQGFDPVRATITSGGSNNDIQKSLLNYEDGLAARNKLNGLCPGRCTDYDYPDMLWHASTEAAATKDLDVVIDIGVIFYGADKILKNGIDVTGLVTERVLRQLHRQ